MSYKSSVTVKSIFEMSVDELASLFESSPYPDNVAGIIDGMNADLLASIFNSSKLSASKASLILLNSNISLSKVYAILASSKLSADKTQAILYNIPLCQRLIDILTYGASDATISSNTTISGVNRYNNLTINSGVTLTVDGQPSVLIVKTLTNLGSIVKTATGATGGAPTTNGGAGGAGGGGLIILAYTLNNSGLIDASGANGGNSVRVTTTGQNGNPGGNGYFLVVGSDSPGTGGDGGYTDSPYYNARGIGKVNGGGGGGIYNYVGGSGGDSTKITYNSYSDLAEDVRKAIVDWFIVNVLGKTPTTTKSLPNIKGSGGGSGASYDYGGGGAGGGGGQIIALVLTLNNTGTIKANGGNGGAPTGGGGAGGGGGGGIVYVLYKSLVSQGTLQANGGAGYNPGGPYDTGKNGTAGTAKAVAI